MITYSKKIVLIFLLGTVVIPGLVLAQGGSVGGNPGGSVGGNPGGSVGGPQLTNYLSEPFKTSVPCLIQGILEIIVNIGSVILVVFIVWTGLMFVMARGNEAKLTSAKEALFYTLIGAAIVLGAFVISKAVEQTVRQLGTLPNGQPVSCDNLPTDPNPYRGDDQQSD